MPRFLKMRRCKAEVRRSFITTTVQEQDPRSNHKGATGSLRVRTGDQRHAIASLETTSEQSGKSFLFSFFQLKLFAPPAMSGCSAPAEKTIFRTKFNSCPFEMPCSDQM